ncbi:MAG: hypothetical protein IT456_08140 [Planctomycetes bacterium]|jgi:hypothetical protein|nr:hypothetical protein [Planctomycetota bacterium]
MDQTLVRSGFDLEIALGERYLQYLLLLALDVGLIPVEFTFVEPEHPEKGPIRALMVVPSVVDRTYALDPAAVLPEEGSPQAFQTEVLFGDVDGADLKVTAKVHLVRAGDGLDVVSTIFLFVRLGLLKVAGGGGLESASLTLELVRASLGFAQLKPLVDRTLSLDALANGGRIADIAMRKFPAQGVTPASLHVYLNLMLRSGPQPGAFLEPRGDVLVGENILPEGADMAFATRSDIYGDLAADAFFRRAVRSGAGYSYPLHFKHRDGTLLGIRVEPTSVEEGANKLRMRIKTEIEVDNWPDPDVTLLVDVFGGVDADGVMTWNSSTTAADSGLLYHLLLAGLSAALIPLFGPGGALLVFSGLEIAKHVLTEEITSYYLSDKVERRLDATLLDIAPNRLTLLRRRWDPFYETQHQIGLRAGGTAINQNGIAMWGQAVLTRTTTVIGSVVIRDTERVDEEAPTALRYRVDDFESVRATIEQVVPGADRRAFVRHDPQADPDLCQVTVADALLRIAEQRLVGAHPYLIKRIEVRDNKIDKLLLVSERESKEQRNGLIAEHREAVTPGIIAAHEAEVRAQVLAEIAATGVFVAPDEVEARVAAGLQAFIDAAVAEYEAGQLTGDLEARLLPLLRFELGATHIGKLQQQGVLTVAEFDLVHLAARDQYYYRDRYVPALETTPAKRLADNLRNMPRFESTPLGPVFVD